MDNVKRKITDCLVSTVATKHQKMTTGKGKCREYVGKDFSVVLFVKVWEEMGKLYNENTLFALRWILRNEESFEAFVLGILNINCGQRRICIRLLHNGYNNAKAYPFLFSEETWAQLDVVFGEQIFFKNLASPIKFHIRSLKLPDLQSLLENQISIHSQKREFSVGEVILQPIEHAVKYTGCFIGSWDSVGATEFKSKEDIFRSVPSDFMVAEKRKNCTFFWDKSSEEPILIAMIMEKRNVIPRPTKSFLWAYMENLYQSHPAVRKKAALTGEMKGHGPFFNMWLEESNRVAFYTHFEKMSKLFKGCGAARQFDDILDKYCHNDMIDIILALYMWLCPEVLRCFFKYSCPYLSADQYEKTPLEKCLNLGGPSLYQFYLTGDYCSRVHKDDDALDLTLCYASHPDANTSSPVDFVLVDHGLRLPVGDGDIFAFRSSVSHATAYRVASSNVAYVGCVTVNNGLRNVLRRRRSS